MIIRPVLRIETYLEIATYLIFGPDFGTQRWRHWPETGSHRRQDLFAKWREVNPHSTFTTSCHTQFWSLIPPATSVVLYGK